MPRSIKRQTPPRQLWRGPVPWSRQALRVDQSSPQSGLNCAARRRDLALDARGVSVESAVAMKRQYSPRCGSVHRLSVSAGWQGLQQSCRRVWWSDSRWMGRMRSCPFSRQKPCLKLLKFSDFRSTLEASPVTSQGSVALGSRLLIEQRQSAASARFATTRYRRLARGQRTERVNVQEKTT